MGTLVVFDIVCSTLLYSGHPHPLSVLFQVKKWERATPEEKAPAPAQAPGDALFVFQGF